MIKVIISALLLVGAVVTTASAQSKHWQKGERALHYTEDQGDFLLVNGRYRFNRALYGDNRASRVEAGDLPEFALYLPGMGGNLQFVIRKGARFKKLIDADRIETRYRGGAMRYRIQDELLGDGHLDLTVIAQYQEEGLLVKMEAQKIEAGTQVYSIYGGASGKTFSRNGDIGADPESGFYLLPAYAEGNSFQLDNKSFTLRYLGKRQEEQFVQGTFGGSKKVALSDAHVLADLTNLENAKTGNSPIVYARYDRFDRPHYIGVAKGKAAKAYRAAALAKTFDQANAAREKLAERIKLRTPDRFINNFASTLSMAADGIWESPSYLHGAVAWRMRLNAWRGAYTADALGWHDRAKQHFSSYLRSQVLQPANGPVVMDTALHLARHIEKMGTAVFSSGYISRNPNNNSVPHHYDMNLVFFDQLFSHFDYTGDKAYLKEVWPGIVRHLEWERRNFDPDADGLYDAYCAIWASDGLQYSGGAVAHSSAYNYRANRAAAKLAAMLGEDPRPYATEADKIEKALKTRLWMSDKGYFAEFQDKLGNRLLHDSPGLWTIYHIADAFLLDDFEGYQNAQYMRQHLPQIPVTVKGQEHNGLYTLATSNWQPYTWSVNNVALAENLQAALAFWQTGRNEDAYLLWKSNIIESMYHGISPGNFQQLSHYDAYRGELYRDFADPVGVASRTLVEGLFGLQPKLMDGEIHVRPGFPESWDFAEIALPQWQYDYKKTKTKISFLIRTQFGQPVKLKMELPVSYAKIESLRINGKEIAWTLKETAINHPVIVFEAPAANDFQIEVQGRGSLSLPPTTIYEHPYTDEFVLPLTASQSVLAVHDPQHILLRQKDNRFQLLAESRKGTFFAQIKDGDMQYWRAIDLSLIAPLEQQFVKRGDQHLMVIKNKTGASIAATVRGQAFHKELTLAAGQASEMEIPASALTKGTNTFQLQAGTALWEVSYACWDADAQQQYAPKDLSSLYNARITDIFQQRYLSPRPEGPTLQLPWQGIGNWCYPLTTANIDDKGLMDARKGETVHYLGIPFLIRAAQKNILFASQWDNYPTRATVPLEGKAKKLYLLMTGSTNPMQSQMVNAKIEVHYVDGGKETLALKNPNNWWPIEQDYLDDGYAFALPSGSAPYRVQLKTGALYRAGTLPRYSDIKGLTSRAVDGGAATLLDVPLDPQRQLQSLTLTAEANDVVVGIIAATLSQ